MLFNILHTHVDILNNTLYAQNKVQVSVLRLDKIHPVISGNKLFKLHYFLEEAMAAPHKKIITFGGAYSNHLAAAAHACKIAGIECTGIVRGEKPASLSHTLQYCIENGMQLHFVPRQDYANKDEPVFLEKIAEQFGEENIIIPEGGFNNTGAKGAALINELIPAGTYTHICTAAGTATTTAGLLHGSTTETIICIPVLKGMADIEERISFCTGNKYDKQRLAIFYEYHFGGYAKKNDELISFMNDLWQQHKLPTDFVYTAKLMYAVNDSIKKGRFAAGSNILCLHTGGLQGNLSLPKGILHY